MSLCVSIILTIIIMYDWFVHRFVNGTIISVLYFIITPAQTVGVVSLILSIIDSAIAFAYIMFSRGCSNKNT